MRPARGPAAVGGHLLLLLLAAVGCLEAKSHSDETLKDQLGYAFEFKVQIPAGKEECFYQEIHPHFTLYVAFQVGAKFPL